MIAWGMPFVLKFHRGDMGEAYLVLHRCVKDFDPAKGRVLDENGDVNLRASFERYVNRSLSLSRKRRDIDEYRRSRGKFGTRPRILGSDAIPARAVDYAVPGLLERAEVSEAIRDIVERLKPTYREALRATTTGKAISGTVKCRAHRARALIRAALREAGFSVPESVSSGARPRRRSPQRRSPPPGA